MKNPSNPAYSVYALQIKETNEPFYVGMCRYMKWRLNGHKSAKLVNSIKYKIIRNNEVEIVQIGVAKTKEEAIRLESRIQ